MKFGQSIKQAREAQGLSQCEVFFRSGVPTNRVSQIERGANCTLRTAFDLAMALGIKTIEVEDSKYILLTPLKSGRNV
jgi:transcriptional regulator with XRE-family HTH domain